MKQGEYKKGVWIPNPLEAYTEKQDILNDWKQIIIQKRKLSAELRSLSQKEAELKEKVIKL